MATGSMTEPVTVVVPCRDRATTLARCLDGLRAELYDGDHLLVVDSASRDGSVAVVATERSVGVVRCDRPGVSLARNTGWRRAATPLVAFVDDDVVVAVGWRAALAAAFEDPEVDFALGILATGTASGRATVVHGGAGRLGAPAEVGVVSAGNLAARVGALAAVGGFDERLGPGTWLPAGEDAELVDRLLEAGHAGVMAPELAATHLAWRSAAEWRRLQWAYGLGTGARVAAALRRHPRAGARQLHRLLRLGGLVTAARRAAGSEPASDAGWTGPIRWRLGALVGLAAGLLRLGTKAAR
jgi:glycosyltransferase involved in cell wall biosynthesis